MSKGTGSRYPNGAAKSSLYERVLRYWLFDCTAEEYAENLEFIRIEEKQGIPNCEWRDDEDGMVVVSDVRLRDSTLRVVVLKSGFAIMPIPAEPADGEVPGFWSVFISYGAPDEKFALRLYRELVRIGIRTFFFPESAMPGWSLHRTMADAINEYDRVVLVCSQNTLNRSGVLNEIEQILAREAREGGSERLIPVVLDGYLFGEWRPDREHIANALRGRVVADFRQAVKRKASFKRGVDRLLKALRRD